MKTILKYNPKIHVVKNGVRGYNSAANRKRAIKNLVRFGYNYFVCYRDTQSEFALTFSIANWVKDSKLNYYVNW